MLMDWTPFWLHPINNLLLTPTGLFEDKRGALSQHGNHATQTLVVPNICSPLRPSALLCTKLAVVNCQADKNMTAPFIQ